MKRLAFFLFFLLLFARGVGFPASAAKAGEALPDAEHELLERIARAASVVETLEGRFEEEKHISLLEAPLLSSGRFYLEPPDRLLWETLEPERAGFAMDGKTARRWRASPEDAEIFPLERAPGLKAFAENVFMWMEMDAVKIQGAYRISVVKEDPVTLKLVPLSAESGPVDHIRIAFSPDLTHARTVEIHEAGGDYTRLRFPETVLNAPRRENLFHR